MGVHKVLILVFPNYPQGEYNFSYKATFKAIVFHFQLKSLQKTPNHYKNYIHSIGLMDIMSTVNKELVPSDRLLIFFNLDSRMIDPKPPTDHSRLLQDLIGIASSNVRAHRDLIVT